MATRPTFSQLRKMFPYQHADQSVAGSVIKGNKDLVQSIGGKLERSLSAIYPDLDLMNTCAVRLSYALNKAGFKISTARGVRILLGGDKMNYTISADEMITYMKAKFGKPVLIWDGRKKSDKRWLGAVKLPTQGMLGYDWQGRIADFGATGHVDIGRLYEANGEPFIADYGTAAYFEPGPMLVYFWECAL